MKKTIFTFLILLVLILSACQSLPATETQAPPIPTNAQTKLSIPLVAVGKEEIEIKYAKNFMLEYKDGYKLLSVKTPDASTAVTYALLPRGGTADVAEKDAIIIQTPIEKIISLSSTYYPMLEQIGKLNTVVGIDDGTYTYNENIRANVENGKIAVVGGDGFSAKLNLEKVIELAPDMLMAPYMNAQVLEEAKLKEAKQTLVLNADYLETSPLGRAEWGIFVAAFYDLEAEASSLFDGMEARYLEVQQMVANIGEKPSVFVNTAYQGSWYMPGKDSYVAELLKDAGANYLFADIVAGTGASPLAFEVVYEKAKDADYWLNVGFAPDLKSLMAEDTRYGEFKAVLEGKVYNNNARVNPNGGTDFYEGGVANPDIVLKDLIKIFYPELLPDYQPFYYSKVN